jgi:hypothetical protein
MNTMRLHVIISAFGLLATANAGLLRFGCAQLTVQRLDPLVNPGSNPSPHLHQIIGGVRDLLLKHIHSIANANRTRSMSPWTQPKAMIWRRNRHAPPASLPKT